MANSPQHVIVTGASSGIGLETANRFLELGATVVAVSRNEAKLRAALPQDLLDTRAIPLAFDLSTEQGCRECGAAALEKLGGELDCLVNNAGMGVMGIPFEELSFEDFELCMRTNLDSMLLMTKACLGALEERKGCVVNISSTAAKKALPGKLAYCVSKAAVDHFTRCCALELASKGIRVNAVNPSIVNTDFLAKAKVLKEGQDPEQFFAEWAKVHPLGRVGSVEDVTEMVLFLASQEKAGWMTGQTVVLDGGRLL